MDRIDIYIHVPRLSYEELNERRLSECSAAVMERVLRTRKIQEKRFRLDPGTRCNAQMSSEHTRDYCRLSDEAQSLIKSSFKQFRLSARAHYKVLKLARTIADMANCEKVETPHLAEALQYRKPEKRCY